MTLDEFNLLYNYIVSNPNVSKHQHEGKGPVVNIIKCGNIYYHACTALGGVRFIIANTEVKKFADLLNSSIHKYHVRDVFGTIEENGSMTYSEVDASLRSDIVSHNYGILDKWYTGDELKSFLDSDEVEFKSRYCLSDIMGYLTSNTNRVCALYGLRRTGKSVLLRQSIRELINHHNVSTNEIMYITLSKSTKINDEMLISFIRENSDKVKYFFIDEISYAIANYDNNALNLLADELVIMKGVRIVITGTESYALKLLSKDVLFDRLYFINTSYFSYKEAKDVLGYSLEKFLERGGIIDDGSIDFNDYLYTFVLSNIVSSIMKSDSFHEVADDTLKETLITTISRIIDGYTQLQLYSSIVNRYYKFSDVGRLTNLIKTRSERDSIDDEAFGIINLPKNVFYERVRKSISQLEELNLSKSAYSNIIKIMFDLGIAQKLNVGDYQQYITSPNYIRYGLCKNIMDELAEDVRNLTNGRYDISIALDALKGFILESTIDIDVYKTFKYSIDKITSIDGFEVDLVIKHKDNTISLYEIKYSSLPLEEHAKNLVNKQFINSIIKDTKCQVRDFNIIYMGVNCTKEILPSNVFELEVEHSITENRKQRWNDLKKVAELDNWSAVTVNYINAEEFLCNL